MHAISVFVAAASEVQNPLIQEETSPPVPVARTKGQSLLGASAGLPAEATLKMPVRSKLASLRAV